jgi:uncharacterized protein YhjY with autotransporter beta-barrel domain
MKNILLGLAMITAASVSVRAQTTIDFSTYAPGTVVTSGPGVTFATQDANGVLGSPAIGNAPYTGGLANSITGSYPTTEFLNVNFTAAASKISFTFDDQGDNGISTYSVYSANHTLLATGPLNDFSGEMVALNVSGAALLQFSNGETGETSYWEFDLDNLTFSEIAALFSLQGLTPNQHAIAVNLNNGLLNGNPNSLAPALATALLKSPQSEGVYLNQLSPQAFGQFTSTTTFNNASFETEAMDEYLANQRGGPNGTFIGGNGGIDASGLTLNDPSYDPNLAMVHSRLLAWNPGPFNGTVSDVARSVLGGVDMTDSKNMKSTAGPAPCANAWNFFVRGNVILAQGFSDSDISHFNDNTESVVLGADYRLTPNFLVGLTAGYGHTDVTLDDSGSSATVDSYSPGLYASYADHGWYADLSGDYVHNAYTQDRKIAFLGQDATSAPEGNEGTANLDGGYDFHQGALTFGPLAGVQYTHLTVDGYNESGSIADLSVNEQQADSLRSRLGGRISAAFSCFGINLRPHLDATWQHEFMDQGRGITSQFEGTGLGSFSVKTENPSRDSALADAGIDAQLDQTWMLFADYQVQAGQENYFGQSVQAGVKIGF